MIQNVSFFVFSCDQLLVANAPVQLHSRSSASGDD